jgi:hypothetical protein
MPIGHKDYSGVPVPPAVALGGRHEPFDLGLRQVLAGAKVPVGTSLGGNCSSYGGWRDQLEMAFSHVFAPPRLLYWSYKTHFWNSWRKKTSSDW